ncbi:MAG: hypothetical protein SFV22_09220, partial [Saprospiraceae bacterium]|nr:hypothetical protein [Saprospiraceae bacterium]
IGEKGVPASEIAQMVVVDFAKKGQFVDVQKAFFLHSEEIKSPMRADVAAFSEKQDMEKIKAGLSESKETDWNTLIVGM